MADDLIDVEDEAGNRFRISAAHRNRYPSVAEAFRPVVKAKPKPKPGRKKTTTPVVTMTALAAEIAPTGDKNKEN